MEVHLHGRLQLGLERQRLGGAPGRIQPQLAGRTFGKPLAIGLTKFENIGGGNIGLQETMGSTGIGRVTGENELGVGEINDWHGRGARGWLFLGIVLSHGGIVLFDQSSDSRKAIH